ncbi:MAG TPA: flagellar basal-body MS-ring/collar protein FliF [Verrucomicrobiae bacterium]|jgi:flagellar M-ring protein FliF|nr:flagellar basal-body MS-ring/collar protein FliF [Verrucomicrobiae bacterium]
MNKNLSQLGNQLLGIWKQLGLNQRISIIMATAVVFVGLGTMAFWSSRPDYSLLYGKLEDGEAAKVVAALDEAKTPYQVRGAGSIYVPSDKVYQTRMQMASKGIPRSDGVGFEIFDKANFGISDFVQRANYTRAVQGELARTISQLDQIESARVMIVMPENRLLIDTGRKPTASVFIRVRGNGQLPSAAVNSIRFLVANSVEGLQVNNVSVVDNMGNVLSENEDSDSVAGLSNNQLTARRNLEQYLTKKAQGMLEQVLGQGQAVVRVSADLDWDSVTRTDEKFDPDGQVVRSSIINDENTESATANATGGAPGVSANGTSDTNAAAPPVNKSHTTKKVTNNSYEINKSTSNVVEAAGSIKRLSTAVFIAQRFEGTGADRKATPRSPEELEKLRHIVQSALGIRDTGDPDRKDEITLEEIPFNDQPAMEITQQLDKQEKQQYWVELAQKALYPALAVGALGLFWALWRKTAKDEIPINIPLPGANGHANGNGNGNGHGRGQNGGLVTVEVLNQLIRENPANMTQAVKNWLARGKPEN